MHIALVKIENLQLKILQHSMNQFVPLAESNTEKIDELEEWATAGKIRLAS